MKITTVTALAAASLFSVVVHAQTDIPGRIQAEDYFSFSDTSQGNKGGAYRSDDVDIQLTTDSGGGYNVGWITAGESLEYPINVEQSGVYKVTLRVASRRAGGTVDLLVDSEPLPNGTTQFGATGGWQNWTDSSFETTLNAGEQTLTLEFLTGGFNINYIDVEYVSPATQACSSPYEIGKNGRCIIDAGRPRSGISPYNFYCEYPGVGAIRGATYNSRLTCVLQDDRRTEVRELRIMTLEDLL